MLGSNNYLGLTGDERVKQAAREALERYGTGLTGSRLMNGTLPLHRELEQEIADWMGTEDALVFTTGYQANLGCLSGVLGPSDTVIADSSRPRLDPRRLQALGSAAAALPAPARSTSSSTMLERAAGDGGGVLVVVDGVYSMEGDICDLPAVTERCRAHGARLMVDEAHARRRARRRAAPAAASSTASRTASTCAWAPSRSRSRAAAASSPARPT